MARNAMAYWVRRFLALGLLQVVDGSPESGRRARAYRSVADEFVLCPGPRGFAPNLPDLQQVFDPLWGRFLDGVLYTTCKLSDDWVGHWYRGAQGEPVIAFIPRAQLDALSLEGSVGFVNQWCVLGLEHGEAQRFARELAALPERHVVRAGGRDRTGLPQYLVHGGLVLMPPCPEAGST